MAPLIDGNGEALASAICGDARGVHCDGGLRRIIPNRHIRLVGAALGKRLSGCLGCRNDHAIRGVHDVDRHGLARSAPAEAVPAPAARSCQRKRHICGRRRR